MRDSKRGDVGLLVLRISLGLIMMFYGSQKLFGAFGGSGFSGTIGFMHDKFGIPPLFGALAMFAEFAGGLGILVGLLTPIAAFGVMCVMLMATYENVSSPGLLNDIFTKGSPADIPRVGFPLMLGTAAIALMLLGAGRYSLDKKFFRPGK